jgi:hypothetical protein
MATRRDVFDKVGGFDHGVNTNEDGIYTLLAEKYGKIVFVDDVTVYMDGRRYNRGIFSAIKEWTDGIGLNAIYIQIMYMLTGEIKHLSKDFRDIRVRPDRNKLYRFGFSLLYISLGDKIGVQFFKRSLEIGIFCYLDLILFSFFSI